MKKDIQVPKVTNIALAAIPEYGTSQIPVMWNVYLINLKTETIKSLMITSKGYGNINEENVKTSTLRWFYDEVCPNEYIKIEPILHQLTPLSHEFWISFLLGNNMLDKKFVFVAESLIEANFSTIPVIEEKGVLLL